MSILLVSSFLLLGEPTAVLPDDVWPQFRGGPLAGQHRGAAVPLVWDQEKNVAWKAEIPGQGWASPIVWKDKVFLTAVVGEQAAEKDKAKKGLYMGGERAKATAEERRWIALCLDAVSGKILWQTELHRGKPAFGKHIKNTYASETPVTDGEHLFVYLGEAGVFCLDFSGKLAWKKEMPAMPTKLSWGFGASPTLHGDRLFIVNDNEKESFVVALDKKTGAELWRSRRDEKSNWATPIIWENSQRTELITTGTNRVRAYSLDGKPLWELGKLSLVTVMSAVADGDLVYVGSGFLMDKNRPLFAVMPGAQGDISPKKDEKDSEFIAWKNPSAAVYHPTPLIVDGLCYILNDMGTLSCCEAKSGQLVYEKQRLSKGGADKFTASPVFCAGKILCLSEDGVTYVVEPGREFKVVGKNSLEGPDEMALATPAVTKDRLFLRTASKLYCIMKTE